VLKEAVKKCFDFRETPIPMSPAELLSKMDRTLLKKGWKTAMASLQDPPDFDEAFKGVMEELQRIFLAVSGKPRGRK
jgi:hypothetical protein